MQCVYSGEYLFPCAFNQEAPEDDIKVFFDYVFRTTTGEAYSRSLRSRSTLTTETTHRSSTKFSAVFGKATRQIVSVFSTKTANVF